MCVAILCKHASCNVHRAWCDEWVVCVGKNSLLLCHARS